jgi:hypothetical protein
MFAIQLEGGSPVALGLSDEGAIVSHAIGSRYACHSLQGPKCVRPLFRQFHVRRALSHTQPCLLQPMLCMVSVCQSLTNGHESLSIPSVLNEMLRQVLAQTVKARAGQPAAGAATNAATNSAGAPTQLLTAATHVPPPPSPSPNHPPHPPTTSEAGVHAKPTPTSTTPIAALEAELADEVNAMLASSDLRRLLHDRFGDVEFVHEGEGGLGELDEHDIVEAYTIDEHGNHDPMDAEQLKQYLAMGLNGGSEGEEPFIEFVTDMTDEEIEEERRKNH